MINPDEQCKEHGCARYRCDESHDQFRYTFTFSGRHKDAIGVFTKIKAEIIAENVDRAVMALYDRYEHIHYLSILGAEKV